MEKKRKIVLIIIGVLIVTALCIAGFTYAKYATNRIWNYYLESKDFYFSSDYLGSESINNVDSLWDGESVYFNVKNNLNDIVVTDYDINYQVVCTVEGEEASNVTCKMNGGETNTQEGVLSKYEFCANTKDDGVDVSAITKTECELGGYEWKNQVAIKDLYFDIVPNNPDYQINNVTVKVTATSTSPYRKSLVGTFELHKMEEKDYAVNLEYKNYENDGKLIISNPNLVRKCLNIAWDSTKLKIQAKPSDFTNITSDANNYINSIKLNIDPKSTLEYTFFRDNLSEIYTSLDFTLTEASEC